MAHERELTVVLVLQEPRNENRYYIEGELPDGDKVSLHLNLPPGGLVPEVGDVLVIPKRRN